jgi:hypothetical protein
MIRTRTKRVEKAIVVVKAAKTARGIEMSSRIGETRKGNRPDMLYSRVR